MQKLWKYYFEWNEKRQQKHFQWWQKKREKGHPRFVLSCAFLFGSFMLFWTIISDYYFDGFINWRKLPFTIVYYFVIGIIIGAVTFWDNERKHQKDLKNKTIR